MKQLRAEKVNGPLGEAYYVERDKGCPLMLFSKQEVIDKYGVNLLNILDTKYEYKSPITPNNQLSFDFK